MKSTDPLSSARWALLALGWVLPSTSLAAACCVGSTSAIPGQVGECERGIVGLSVGGAWSTGRMDRSAIYQSVSVHEATYSSTLQLGVRLHRQWQLGASLPALLQHRFTDDTASWGGGPGDLRFGFVWDPMEERPRTPGRAAVPVPIVSFGLRVPTGRSWTQSRDTLHADVTGRGEVAAVQTIQAERTVDKTPWAVGLTTEVSLGSATPALSAQLYTSLGRYLGRAWTIQGVLSHEVSWAQVGTSSVVQRTNVSARVIYGVPLAWRAWFGIDGDLPIPYLGRSATTYASAQGGVVWVW